ncbi:alpha-glucuronidase family glycosyl hydrolase [Mariniphaga sp.]|uniref:alpha-glucuronidase family glycosyl hydrolase n=1 Tax=Mariniphaga sp. TaxID=1954475 RepID=UPI00356A5ED9
MKTLKFHLAVILFILPSLNLQAENEVMVIGNQNSEQIQFAVNEIQTALKKKVREFVFHPVSQIKQIKSDEYNIILLNINDKSGSNLLKELNVENIDELKEEGFIVNLSGENGRTIWVLGKDDAGVMYGGFEVAEIIRLRGFNAIENQLQNPYMKVRGTKFNIPLDVRTPTYTEPSDAAQINMAEMWNFEFWKEYIDNLARYRYNTISLWNMHPFPSMVKVPEYPDVALDDVRKSTVDWEENYPLNGWDFDAPEIVNNYEVIKKITIDEKIEFWRKVMAYGKKRNVQFFILTWNIFDYGVDGKYGIDDKLENPVTTDYFRQSIKQMVLTYPDLAGIGLTTGENMYAYTATQKEEWAFTTYGQGVLDALKEQPDRKITFIHRQHQTQAKEITAIFKDVMKNENINFIFSFKYAQAHVYSSTNQVFHQNFVKDIQSENLKTLWTLRNDDIFYYRWGAPDFVREFIKNIPYDVSEGYYYGSDQYVWGREFLGKYSEEPRELEIVKHWYQWMCWGRLGYNPDMENERFTDVIQNRFPTVNAQDMFDTWQNASMIYPWVNGFHWGALDFQWYIESGQSQPAPANTPSGYHDVNRFITLPPHKGTGYISIPDYTKAFLAGTETEGETPVEVAEKINNSADKALEWVFGQTMEMDKELRNTIDDIRTIAYLGKYYAHKILAATYLSIFRESFQKEWVEKSMEELNISAGYWRQYAAGSLANYKTPLWTNRVGYVDLKENFQWAVYDITVNGGDVNLPSMKPTPGGTILEAEDAKYGEADVENDIDGYTGDGYLTKQPGHAQNPVKWTYTAAEPGRYILEFRYTLERQQEFLTPLTINGEKVDEIGFWQTGNGGAWVWLRKTVNLEKGENTIEISPEGYVFLDHLNVLKNF